MQVIKFSGDRIDFDAKIFKNSLAKSGASNEQVVVVYDYIISKMYDGISTKELYELAYNELFKIKNSFAARYSLKRALRELGPEGYYFEKWVSKIFEQLGFNSTTSKTLKGNAVTHEIDVLAHKTYEFHLCECKFRNDEDAKISVTTPMYFLSRFNDLKSLEYEFFGKLLKPTHGWLITNAYFTLDSVAFATYYDINILSWDYPKGASLKNITDNMRLYPITCLTSITLEEKKFLLSKNVVMVNDIYTNPKKLDDLKCSSLKLDEILLEAKELVDTN